MIAKTMTLTEVAKHCDIKKRTFHRMVNDGRFSVDPIPGTKPRLWAFEHVEAWRLSR